MVYLFSHLSLPLNLCPLFPKFQLNMIITLTLTWSNFKSSSGVSGNCPKVSGGFKFTSLPNDLTTSSRLYLCVEKQIRKRKEKNEMLLLENDPSTCF